MITEESIEQKRERLVREILRDYPPIRRLEEIMGPEPAADEREEVDAFLGARVRWQQPYPAPE
jgi:hypothetical protein